MDPVTQPHRMLSPSCTNETITQTSNITIPKSYHLTDSLDPSFAYSLPTNDLMAVTVSCSNVFVSGSVGKIQKQCGRPL